MSHKMRMKHCAWLYLITLSDHGNKIKLLFLSALMEGISPLYNQWTMFTALNTMPLFVGLHIHQTTHVDIIHYHAIYCRSDRRAAGCLPLALGPAFTQVASTICIIATPARTTDKQASGWTQQDTRYQLPCCVRACICLAQFRQNTQPDFFFCLCWNSCIFKDVRNQLHNITYGLYWWHIWESESIITTPSIRRFQVWRLKTICPNWGVLSANFDFSWQ